MLKRTQISVSLALALCLFVVSCSPTKLAVYAEKVGKYALQSKPFFASLQNSVPILARIDQVAADSSILANALRGNDHASVLTATAAVINGIEALIDQDSRLITNEAMRSKVIGFLTSAEIAIGIIVDTFPDAHHAYFLTQEQRSAVETIRRFKAKVRCRASGPVKLGDKQYKAGQFVPMAACKQFPDNTQVERFRR